MKILIDLCYEKTTRYWRVISEVFPRTLFTNGRYDENRTHEFRDKVMLFNDLIHDRVHPYIMYGWTYPTYPSPDLGETFWRAFEQLQISSIDRQMETPINRMYGVKQY